jgi:hypothetical protein
MAAAAFGQKGVVRESKKSVTLDFARVFYTNNRRPGHGPP